MEVMFSIACIACFVMLYLQMTLAHDEEALRKPPAIFDSSGWSSADHAIYAAINKGFLTLGAISSAVTGIVIYPVYLAEMQIYMLLTNFALIDFMLATTISGARLGMYNEAEDRKKRHAALEIHITSVLTLMKLLLILGVILSLFWLAVLSALTLFVMWRILKR